jgi:electron transfer flavoprotein alpha subunit
MSDHRTGPADGTQIPAVLPHLPILGVIHVRGGELPPDAAEVIAEAGGAVLIVGDGAAEAATAATAATGVWWCDTGRGLRPGLLASRIAPLVAGTSLLVLPGSADGRDLAPRLAATLGRPLLALAARAVTTPTGVRADLCRLDDAILVPVEVDGPAVVTLEPGAGMLTAAAGPPEVTAVTLPEPGPGPADVTVLEVIEPDPAAMDLAEAPLVVGGGAGLAAGLDAATATATFGLLADVAAALGAAAGATRVATDAGWAGPDRQIGTTGVAIRPRLYAAFGVSGAIQHTSGLGAPRHIVSVNLDPHCPMTAGSTFGIVADARGTLVEVADRLGVPVPSGVRAPRQVHDA